MMLIIHYLISGIMTANYNFTDSRIKDAKLMIVVYHARRSPEGTRQSRDVEKGGGSPYRAICTPEAELIRRSDVIKSIAVTHIRRTFAINTMGVLWSIKSRSGAELLVKWSPNVSTCDEVAE